MASSPTVQADLPIPPEVGSILVYAVTSSPLGTAIDLSAYVERFVTVQNDSSGPMYLNFGSGTQSIDDTVVTGTGTQTSLAALLAPYDSQPFVLRTGGLFHLQAKLASGAAAGKIRIYVSSATAITGE